MMMEYIKHLITSIEYIENNLDSNITIADCANKAGYSLFYYCRIFQMTTNISVMEYIRKRRLTKIAKELFNTDKKINEIYHYWGFNSHENFIRAFKKMFGITPREYRKAKSSLNLYHKIDLAKIKLPDFNDIFFVKPKIINKPSIKFAGYDLISKEIKININTNAPKMWNRYHALNLGDTIPNCVNKNERYDIGLMVPSKEFLKYFIGVEVDSYDNMPNNIIKITIPATTYAVFSTPKSDTFSFVKTIHRTWHFIYQQWFPDSVYTHNGTYEFETYCEDSRTFSEDIYIPVYKEYSRKLSLIINPPLSKGGQIKS